MYASLTPLRFAGGRHTPSAAAGNGRSSGSCEGGREMLYILNFYLPRFLDLPLDEKLITVVHELWHIGPRFDGDLRRFGGRCYAHSGSQRKYDAEVKRLVAAWLAPGPPAGALRFPAACVSRAVRTARPHLRPEDRRPEADLRGGKRPRRRNRDYRDWRTQGQARIAATE